MPSMAHGLAGYLAGVQEGYADVPGQGAHLGIALQLRALEQAWAGGRGQGRGFV